MAAQKIVYVIEDARRIRTQRHSRQRPLQHRREQRGAQSFAGNVCQQKSGAIVAQRKHVEIIASDRQARKIHARNRQMRILAKIFGQQRLLNIARDINFLLHALAFAFALHQPRIVQNAGRVCRQRVQNLPV